MEALRIRAIAWEDEKPVEIMEVNPAILASGKFDWATQTVFETMIARIGEGVATKVTIEKITEGNYEFKFI
jgi:hypothetical protein